MRCSQHSIQGAAQVIEIGQDARRRIGGRSLPTEVGIEADALAPRTERGDQAQVVQEPQGSVNRVERDGGQSALHRPEDCVHSRVVYPGGDLAEDLQPLVGELDAGAAKRAPELLKAALDLGAVHACSYLPSDSELGVSQELAGRYCSAASLVNESRGLWRSRVGRAYRPARRGGTLMKGHPEIIKTLNDLLAKELTAINQYMVHSEMCDNWGYARLHKGIEKIAIDEMKHAEKLIGRILFLEGTPTVSKLNQLKIGADVKAIIESDLGGENDAIASYNKAIQLAAQLLDDGTKQLLTAILADEERHVDFHEAHRDQIQQMGLPVFLVNQTRE
jgi:bacterioferritin